MKRSYLDHIAITAPNLGAGARFVREALGVSPQPGGEHPRMGTHNLLLRLGDDCYLEVIAVNPQAARPGRPRWFGLDALTPNTAPRLAAWVARGGNIAATAAASTEPLGAIESMSRGNLDWQITIPGDGMPVLGGAAPSLIQWPPSVHPAGGLIDYGLRLARLELCHPEPDRLQCLLDSLRMQGPIAISRLQPEQGQAPYLKAHIETPYGLRIL